MPFPRPIKSNTINKGKRRKITRAAIFVMPLTTSRHGDVLSDSITQRQRQHIHIKIQIERSRYKRVVRLPRRLSVKKKIFKKNIVISRN
jgi:hypothetical protein